MARNANKWICKSGLFLFFILGMIQSLNSSKSKVKDWKIFNGQPGFSGEFPALVSLSQDISLIHICGGTLINEDKVLTAAHCFVDFFIFEIKGGIIALVGRTWTNKHKRSTVKYAIKNYIPHEKYRKPDHYEPQNFDIAIIVLKTYVPESYFVKYAKLSGRRSKLQNDIEVIVAGFGMVNSTKDSDVVRYGKMTVISQERCLSAGGPSLRQKRDQKFFCAVSPPSMPCHADSGGPVYYERVFNDKSGKKRVEQIQYGIISVYLGNTCETAPLAIFTSVSDYREWIKKHSGAEKVEISRGCHILNMTGLMILTVVEIFKI